MIIKASRRADHGTYEYFIQHDKIAFICRYTKSNGVRYTSLAVGLTETPLEVDQTVEDLLTQIPDDSLPAL